MASFHRSLVVQPAWRSRRAILALAGFGLIASACGSSSNSSASSVTSSVSNATSPSTSSLSSAASFFVGKTITLIAPDAPGGGFDAYSRLIAPELGKMLKATVNVENVPGGGTITGTDKMAASAPDGLTLGAVNVPGDIGDVLQHNTALNVSLDSLSWIGLASPETLVMVASNSSPYKTFAQLEKATANVKFGGSKSGISWVGGATIMRAFKIPTTFLTGYGTQTQVSQGIIANEFDVAFGDISGSFYSDLVGKKAELLLVSGPSSVPSVQQVISGAPTSSQIISQLSGNAKAAVSEAFSLGNLGFSFAGPKGIPADRLAVLRNAFMQAVDSPSVKAQAIKESLSLAPIDGATLAGKIKAALAGSGVLGPFIN